MHSLFFSKSQQVAITRCETKLSKLLLLRRGVCKVSIKRTSGCTVVLFFPQIYDTATGHKILTLHDSNNTNNYSKNLASFNPTDDLVLNDGVLWDVKGKRVIHKFDKFNNFVSGVFHPSGLEIHYQLGNCILEKLSLTNFTFSFYNRFR